jgi:two-component system, sensor histidine kinase
MSTLPRNARLYLIAVWGIAAGLLGFILLKYPPQIQYAPLFFLWLILLILSDYFEADFEIGPGNRLIVTITETAMIFLVAVEGYSATILIVIGAALVGIARQHDWYKNLFNTAQRSICFILMCAVYTTLHAPGTTPFSGLLGPITLLAISVIGYMLNAFFVTTMIALASEQLIMQVYRKTFTLIPWLHLITFTFGGILAILWAVNPWLLALGVLPLVFAQRAFRAVAAWQAGQKAELAAINTKLHHTQQARFDAVLAETHTANNHLSAILSAAEDVLQHLSGDFAQEGDRLRGTITTMGTFIDDMQALALLQRDQLVLHRREADIAAVVGDAAQRVETAYHQQHILLRVSAIVNESSLHVMCDPPRLIQIFQFLLEQARVAVGCCQIGMVVVELSATPTYITVQITDNGAGIDSDELAVLQAQIGQVTSGEILLAESEFGLLSCARLIALHNGNLVVDSAGIRKGTTITISLPRCTSPAAPSPPHTQKSLPHSSLRILLVDDDVTVTTSLARLLQQRGYDVVATPDGRDGLLSYQARRFDVVVCDVLMPNLSGPAFVRALRAYDPHAAILALSGQAHASQVEEMLAAGACEAISKPCLVEDLIAAIARI